MELSLNEKNICNNPKTIRAAPPITPITSFTIISLAMVRSPRAKSIMRVNSTKVCETENIKPPLAPVLVPCVTVAKNRGPGARAPEAVIRTTVTMKPSYSIVLTEKETCYKNFL